MLLSPKTRFTNHTNSTKEVPDFLYATLNCPSVKTHFIKVVNSFIINVRPAGFGLVSLIRYIGLFTLQ